MSPRTFEQEIYDELRALAAHRMRGQNPGHTLQATALVHEVFEKMARGNPTLIRDRNHFFALASLAMHQVLVQHARQRAAQKRGGGWHRVTLNEGLVPGRTQEFDLYTLHELLEELDELDTRQAQIVKMRRAQVDELIEQLRPLPGHRLRLLNLFEEQRACAAPLEPTTRVCHALARATARSGTHTFEPRLGQVATASGTQFLAGWSAPITSAHAALEPSTTTGFPTM